MADHRDPDIRRRTDGSIDSDFYIARARHLHARAYSQEIPRWIACLRRAGGRLLRHAGRPRLRQTP